MCAGSCLSGPEFALGLPRMLEASASIKCFVISRSLSMIVAALFIKLNVAEYPWIQILDPGPYIATAAVSLGASHAGLHQALIISWELLHFQNVFISPLWAVLRVKCRNFQQDTIKTAAVIKFWNGQGRPGLAGIQMVESCFPYDGGLPGQGRQRCSNGAAARRRRVGNCQSEG